MAIEAYAEITDSGGNQIKGDVEVEGRVDMVEVIKFDHNVRIPTDKRTGELTGVRQHRPAKLVKNYDSSSPLLFDALCNGETLQEVILHWYKIDPTGKEVEYFTHTFKGAKISAINSFMYNTKDPSKEQFTHMEEVSLLYEEVTWLYKDGNIEYNDSWTAER